MPNPNEYDDEAYTEAANHFQNVVTPAIDKLWRAGAEVTDITNEFNTAFDNSDAEADEE